MAFHRGNDLLERGVGDRAPVVRGVQRGIVQSTLDRHPCVSEFWDDPDAHLGATIARLAPQPEP